MAKYCENQRINECGSVEDAEEKDALELDFNKAVTVIKTSEIKDAKTIMLL